jgi:hypothetical protein
MYQIDFYFEELVPFKAKSLTNGEKGRKKEKYLE